MKNSELVSHEIKVKTWIAALAGLTNPQLKYGHTQISLGRCYLEFPPNPGQFRLLCQSMPDPIYSKPVDPEISKAKEVTKLDRDRTWFKNLPREGKERVWNDALKAQHSLEGLLNASKLSIFDFGFENDVWFKPVMGAFKSYNRLEIFPDNHI
jgi:hypothetical protein